MSGRRYSEPSSLESSIVEYLNAHPGSYAGDIAKSLEIPTSKLLLTIHGLQRDRKVEHLVAARDGRRPGFYSIDVKTQKPTEAPREEEAKSIFEENAQEKPVEPQPTKEVKEPPYTPQESRPSLPEKPPVMAAPKTEVYRAEPLYKRPEPAVRADIDIRRYMPPEPVSQPNTDTPAPDTEPPATAAPKGQGREKSKHLLEEFLVQHPGSTRGDLMRADRNLYQRAVSHGFLEMFPRGEKRRPTTTDKPAKRAAPVEEVTELPGAWHDRTAKNTIDGSAYANDTLRVYKHGLVTDGLLKPREVAEALGLTEELVSTTLENLTRDGALGKLKGSEAAYYVDRRTRVVLEKSNDNQAAFERDIVPPEETPAPVPEPEKKRPQIQTRPKIDPGFSSIDLQKALRIEHEATPESADRLRKTLYKMMYNEPGHKLGHYARQLGVTTDEADTAMKALIDSGNARRSSTAEGQYIYGPSSTLAETPPLTEATEQENTKRKWKNGNGNDPSKFDITPEQYRKMMSLRALRGVMVGEHVTTALTEYFGHLKGNERALASKGAEPETTIQIKALIPEDVDVRLDSLKVLSGASRSYVVRAALDYHFERVFGENSVVKPGGQSADVKTVIPVQDVKAVNVEELAEASGKSIGEVVETALDMHVEELRSTLSSGASLPDVSSSVVGLDLLESELTTKGRMKLRAVKALTGREPSQTLAEALSKYSIESG